VLWGCFLGLQLGKSRFPRCSAPYFIIFAVQACATCITAASQAVGAVANVVLYTCQCVQVLRSVKSYAHTGARVQQLPELLSTGADSQSLGAYCWLQAALSLAANVLFTYQARRAATAEARQASAQPILRPQVLPSDHRLESAQPRQHGLFFAMHTTKSMLTCVRRHPQVKCCGPQSRCQ
jgi:hypothetical protein